MFIKSCLLATTLIASVTLATNEPMVDHKDLATPPAEMHQNEPAQMSADHKSEAKPAKKERKKSKKKLKKTKRTKQVTSHKTHNDQAHEADNHTHATPEATDHNHAHEALAQ